MHSRNGRVTQSVILRVIVRVLVAKSRKFRGVVIQRNRRNSRVAGFESAYPLEVVYDVFVIH